MRRERWWVALWLLAATTASAALVGTVSRPLPLVSAAVALQVRPLSASLVHDVVDRVSIVTAFVHFGRQLAF